MILTTSRKPSRKTRRLAKVLARFMGWMYVQRGKLSLEEISTFGDFAVIQEVKGNPAVLRVFKKGKEVLSIRFNVGEIVKTKIDPGPVAFIGKPNFDPLILEAIPQTKAGMKFTMKFEPKKKIYVRRKGKLLILEFVHDKEIVMRLKCYESGIRLRD